MDIEDATEFVLLAALETTLTSAQPDAPCLARLDLAEAKGYPLLLAEQEADVRGFMERVHFSLGEGPSGLPTDVRLAAYRQGGQDPGLMTLAFQYGRYLTVASSRENSPLPTHMGGIWNDNIYNKQDSTQDMHLDMNLQMQYWPAFPCGLAECFLPAARWLRDTLVPAGEEAARAAYGMGGWVAHITSNPWGYAALGWAYNWGAFSFGGAWCATLLWDYFDYTRDWGFLRGQAYPILLGAARFMLDYLFYDQASGYWMTGPSYSPENHYQAQGKVFTLALSPTCDLVLVREVFTLVLRAAKLLALPEDGTLGAIRERLAGLPPGKVGRHGQVQEWFEDFEEPIPNHRHASHLLGLYPFGQITPEATPGLAQAAQASLRRRLEGFEKTSWGYNLFAGMYARLYQGDTALAMLEENLRALAAANLTVLMPLDVAMWAGTWELDGNTGFSAAICEMLAQSRATLGQDGNETYEVRLLPALPRAWPQGRVEGLRLRGGMTLDLRWAKGRLEAAALTSAEETDVVVLYGGQGKGYRLKAGEQVWVIDVFFEAR
jgi:alpha-L-fucosidase 2